MWPLIPVAHGTLGNLDEIVALVIAGVLAFILLASMILKAFKKEEPQTKTTPEQSKSEGHSPLP